MYEGLDHIGKAASTLTQEAGTLKDRLGIAAVELAIAVTRPDQWPGDLLKEAHRIDRELFADGNTEQTISQMDESEANRVAQEILCLAEELNSEQSRSRS